MIIAGIIFIIMHILVCVLTFIGIHLKILKVHKYMFFVVLCLPFWGILAVLFLNFEILFRQDNTIMIDVPKMKLDSVLYKGVSVEEKKNNDVLVPIEEALLINSPKERREIIMDVLNDNPKEYVTFLQKAGNNEDPEVVHYAVTAMVEISKENDEMLQKLGREYSKSPDDLSVLTKYCDFLWGMLEQKLLSGQVEIMNRNLFSQLISKKLSASPSLEDYIRYFENEFALGNFTSAAEIIAKTDELYHDSEETLLMKLKYYSEIKNGDKIKEAIDELQSNKRFVSGKTKEAIAFWRA